MKFPFFLSGTYTVPSLINITSCLHAIIARIHLNVLSSLFSFQYVKSIRPLSSSCDTSSVSKVQQHSLHWPTRLKRKLCQEAVISSGSLQRVTECLKHQVNCIYIMHGPKYQKTWTCEHLKSLEKPLADLHSPALHSCLKRSWQCS